MDLTKFFVPQNPLHTEDEQVKRQKAAMKLSVQSISSDSQTGTINEYHVSLEECSCRDFIIRRKPCKHMYRLAHELGVFTISDKVINDPTIKNCDEIAKEKQMIIELVQTLSKREKTVLYLVMYEYIYHGKHPSAFEQTLIPPLLLEKNLVTLVAPEVVALAKVMRKDTLKTFIKAHHLPIKLNGSKTLILEILQRDYPGIFQNIIEGLYFVIPSTAVMSTPRKVYGLIQPSEEP